MLCTMTGKVESKLLNAGSKSEATRTVLVTERGEFVLTTEWAPAFGPIPEVDQFVGESITTTGIVHSNYFQIDPKGVHRH
jgi:hypothetical protein